MKKLLFIPLAALALAAPAAAGVTGPAFYVDGQLYRTVLTPTDLSGTGAPESSYQVIYDFGGLQPNVATAAPGDPGYRGGRWAVHALTFADYAAAVAAYDTNGSGDLVVDEESTIRDVVVRYLRRDGYATLEAEDGDAARALLEREWPNLVVLDLMLPGTDGLVGLELGADDYVTKPFSPRELVARVRTVLRRGTAASEQPDERVRFGDVELDAAAREIRKGGRPLKLTAREFDLLWFLARHPRRVFSREQLMSRVWGYEPASDSGTVTVHVRRLREKIEDDPAQPRHLETVWGVGYRLSP